MHPDTTPLIDRNRAMWAGLDGFVKDFRRALESAGQTTPELVVVEEDPRDAGRPSFAVIERGGIRALQVSRSASRALQQLSVLGDSGRYPSRVLTAGRDTLHALGRTLVNAGYEGPGSASNRGDARLAVGVAELKAYQAMPAAVSHLPLPEAVKAGLSQLKAPAHSPEAVLVEDYFNRLKPERQAHARDEILGGVSPESIALQMFDHATEPSARMTPAARATLRNVGAKLIESYVDEVRRRTPAGAADKCVSSARYLMAAGTRHTKAEVRTGAAEVDARTKYRSALYEAANDPAKAGSALVGAKQEFADALSKIVADRQASLTAWHEAVDRADRRIRTVGSSLGSPYIRDLRTGIDNSSQANANLIGEVATVRQEIAALQAGSWAPSAESLQAAAKQQAMKADQVNTNGRLGLAHTMVRAIHDASPEPGLTEPTPAASAARRVPLGKRLADSLGR